MTRETAMKILDAQEKLDKELMNEYRERHDLFLQLLYRLQEKEQNILMDYLGVCLEIHLKLLETIAEM